MQPGELQQYNVIRVAAEILVDLMRSAGGIEYEEAVKDVVVREIQGVPIPFASPLVLRERPGNKVLPPNRPVEYLA